MTSTVHLLNTLKDKNISKLKSSMWRCEEPEMYCHRFNLQPASTVQSSANSHWCNSVSRCFKPLESSHSWMASAVGTQIVQHDISYAVIKERLLRKKKDKLVKGIFCLWSTKTVVLTSDQNIKAKQALYVT